MYKNRQTLYIALITIIMTVILIIYILIIPDRKDNIVKEYETTIFELDKQSKYQNSVKRILDEEYRLLLKQSHIKDSLLKETKDKLNNYIENSNIKIDTITIYDYSKVDSLTNTNTNLQKKYIDLQNQIITQDTLVYLKNNPLILQLDSLKSHVEIIQNKNENLSKRNYQFIIFIIILVLPSIFLFFKIVEFIPSKKQTLDYQTETEPKIWDNIYKIKQRLSNEIEISYAHANLHFLIAFLVSWFLISFIGYFGFTFSSTLSNFTNWFDFSILYLPRLIVVLGLGTLFLYFMKSYKTKLIDIKYYQNEITNIELKIIALKTAFIKDDKNILEKVSINFVEAERNFKLNTNETTKELERLKIENEFNTKYLDKFWSLTNMFSKKEKQNTDE